MRASRVAGPLLAGLLFMHGAAEAAPFAPGPGESPPPPVSLARSVLAQATPAATPAAPAGRPLDLEYLPRGDGRGGAGEIGWLLITAAVVLAVIIVVFVIRHHRTGRAG